MSYGSTADRALNQYRHVGASGAAYADPHRLIQMLMEGALSRIAAARGAMQRGETAVKGQETGKAISIVEGLRDSLDMARGGDLAQNLHDLYAYMERRLLQANAGNDEAALDEVVSLLRELKDAWDAIAPEARAIAASGGTSPGIAVAR